MTKSSNTFGPEPKTFQHATNFYFTFKFNFNTMLSAEIMNHIHLSETFFCRGRRELRTDIDQDRRSALHFGITDHIKGQCQLQITTTKQKVFEQTENSWIVFTEKKVLPLFQQPKHRHPEAPTWGTRQ